MIGRVVCIGWVGVMALSLSAGALGQGVPAAPIKPVLQIKPRPFVPAPITKATLKPQIKPSIHASVVEDDDVYVPPAQVNAFAPIKPVAPVVVASAPAAIVAHTAPKPTASSVPAQVGVAEFVGRYLGAGVEVSLTPTTMEPPRRMSQVEIKGDASQFTIRWATVKLGANFKPEPVKSTEQVLTFRAAGTPSDFVAVATDAGQAAPEASARIDGRTMIITKTETLPSGVRSVQRYERTLSEPGMNVVFTRSENGAVVRQVNLSLTKGPLNSW